MARVPFLALTLTFACAACKSSADRGGAPLPSAQPAEKSLAAAKKPPALRAPHPPVPPLPQLPPLSEHEKPEATPPGFVDKVAAIGHGCGAVWNGSDVIPLECVDTPDVKAPEHAAVPLLPAGTIRPLDIALPAVVDHRAEKTEGSVRNQGPVPACSAFALASAVDHAIARWTGAPSAVSVMHIWSRYHQPTERLGARVNEGLAIGGESDWPFAAREAVSWLACPSSRKPPASGCGLAPDAARLARIESKPIAQITAVEYIMQPDTPTLKLKIAAGQDVIVAMELPTTFAPRGAPGARYVPHDPKEQKQKGDAGHALVLAGYASFAHGTYFLAHNSWGTGWGDAGFVWLHEASIARWAYEAYVIDAAPVDANGDVKKRRVRGERTCEKDLVPDSVDGLCTPPCPDGSPRHGGVCATAGQCPSGYVNLTGACVLAAPTSRGSHAASRIRWACGPGGCTYWLPKDADPGCTGAECMASCPAPDFRVARANGAITCVE